MMGTSIAAYEEQAEDKCMPSGSHAILGKQAGGVWYPRLRTTPNDDEKADAETWGQDLIVWIRRIAGPRADGCECLWLPGLSI